jgi:phosphohistidine phosphatase
MDLYIIRHAWAGQYGDPQWPDDSLRPLTAEGRKRFARLVEKLAERDFGPRIVATSPLVRCRQTADLVAAGVPGKPPVVELAELEPGSDLDGLLEWTAAQAQQHDRVAWVGHAPDVDRLAAALVGEGDSLIHFAKGAVAAIRFDEETAAGRGELRWLITAKLLGC